jgi:hypothetical protein
MIRIAYRPRFSPSHKLFAHPLNDVPPIRIDWRSGGYCGISTNDIDEALAWMAEARKFGQKVTLPAPLSKVITRGAGSSKLECGHIVNSPPWHTKYVRCATCLPVIERRKWLKRRHTK